MIFLFYLSCMDYIKWFHQFDVQERKRKINEYSSKKEKHKITDWVSTNKIDAQKIFEAVSLVPISLALYSRLVSPSYLLFLYFCTPSLIPYIMTHEHCMLMFCKNSKLMTRQSMTVMCESIKFDTCCYFIDSSSSQSN